MKHKNRERSAKHGIRPVSRDRLLDAIELLADRPKTSLDKLRAYLNTSMRRVREIATLLESLGLVSRVDENLVGTESMKRFVDAWTTGDLKALNTVLEESSTAYRAFVRLMREYGPLPAAGKLTPQDSEYEIIKAHGFNQYGYDTLGRLAKSLGALHPSDGKLYYALNEPTQVEFDETLLEIYQSSKIREGYADMADVADAVCQRLGISLSTFEEYFSEFWSHRSERLSSSSAALQNHKGDQIVTLRKRGQSPRFDRRYLSDGVNVKAINVKALKVSHG